MADIEKLRKLLDEALANETPESLEKWLKEINHHQSESCLERAFMDIEGIYILPTHLSFRDHFNFYTKQRRVGD